MYIKNTKNNFGLIAILLHWIMTILIIGLFILGEYMVDLDYYNKWYHLAPWWHKSIGIFVVILLIIRIFWRFVNITPQPLKAYKVLEIKIAKVVHFLLYMLLLIICISGYFIATAKGVSIDIFGWFNLQSIIKLSDVWAEIMGKTHMIAANILVALFILHTLASLKHHFFNKDITLMRMLSPKKIKEEHK